MMKFAPWIFLILFNLVWFGYWEVRAIAKGDVETLSASIRAFSHLNPIVPWLLVIGFAGLMVHLYVQWK